mgnify:CR=1 FL=1
MCAIASGELWRILSRVNLNAELILCSGKCWSHVLVHCKGYYIDVTATQFGDHPRVVIMTEEEYQAREEWYWKEEAVRFATDIELHQYQQEKYWPDEQLCLQEI